MMSWYAVKQKMIQISTLNNTWGVDMPLNKNDSDFDIK